MEHWIEAVLLGLATLIASGVGYLAYLGLRAPSRPLRVFYAAWSIALRCVVSAPRAVFALAALIGAGSALQIASNIWPVFDNATLTYISIVWQGLTATLVAGLALYVHLFIIHEELAKRRFGSDTLFYRGKTLNETLHARPPSLKLLAQAMGFGVFIWLISMFARALSNWMMLVSQNRVLALGEISSPQLVFFAIDMAAVLIGFILSSTFMLIRPALAYNLKNPLGQGLALAVRNAPALYSLAALLLVAPTVLASLSVIVPRLAFGGAPIALAVSAFGFLMFSIFQIVVVETATVLFANRVINLQQQKSSPESVDSEDPPVETSTSADKLQTPLTAP